MDLSAQYNILDLKTLSGGYDISQGGKWAEAPIVWSISDFYAFDYLLKGHWIKAYMAYYSGMFSSNTW